ncbi:long-chain fatty acid--CoA ligase [Desulfonema ishimotonii]|uniref:Long-chain fatty acid--CoA ligase n=1 Tax=Desulfonema ishimotonii TaxID=45657 RepID=A0A401FUX8_9BACT|nr:long-chain fatty acid--CoA ligase [Desulfonema ishimotonii]GBC60787.1 long-chain fatty acid--CoA ligase [Desulfonema ishimotonii]
MQIRDYRNIHEMFRETVDRQPEKIAAKWFTGPGKTESVTWAQFYSQVKRAAKSLMALEVAKGDKVNIISYTSYRWVLADLAITAVGACTVGIYQSNLPKDCQYIIDHSDAVLIFAEDAVQLEKLMEIRADIPRVRKVILMNGPAPEDDWIIGFDTFMGLGEHVPDEAFQARAAAVGPEDPAGIIYTSGTTGVPKGAVLTHDNMTFTAQSVFGSTEFEDEYEKFLFLPLAHVFARTCFYTALFAGNTTIFNRSMDTLIEDLAAARPHWFASVPRIFEKVYSKIISGAEAKGGAALKIFRWACAVGDRASDCRLDRRPVPPLLGLQYRLADKLVFSKVRAAFGGRVRWCISGAAPLNPDIGKFFHAAGVVIIEGVGMTEDTSFSHLNRPDNCRYGWVGVPGPGIEQKLAEDGEVMIRGRNVMKEYYKMPQETAENITPDGWLLTGDIGEIDPEHFLKITGRKKEIIITAGGKNVAPAHIEGVLATSKYVNQVCVIGDRRKYLTALVTLDAENIEDYARQKGISFANADELATHPKIVELIDAQVAEKNRNFPSFETIKKVSIVPEFSIENGLLTPTMKLKKGIAMEQFRDRIDGMYPEA